MRMPRCHPLDPGFTVDVRGSAPALSPAVAAAVDAVWDAEKALRGDRLFEGPVLSLVSHAPDRLVVSPMTYRHLIAARRRPALRAAIGVRPVGVTGLVVCRDGLVLGRRAGHVAADAGLWEPAPAGGLDRPDPAGVLLGELREELGLSGADAGTPEPIGMIEDPGAGTLDILMRLPCPLDAAAVRQAHRAGGSDEYSELAIVPPAGIAAFLRHVAGRTLAVLPDMLRAAGFIVD